MPAAGSTGALQHDAALAAVRAELADTEARRAELAQDLAGRVDAVRRQAKAEHTNQLAALKAKANARLEAARREGEAALAAKTAQVEAAARHTREDTTRAVTAAAQQRDAEAQAQTRAEMTRAEGRLGEVERTLAAVRMKADLAQAEVDRLQGDHTRQLEQVRREARAQQARELKSQKAQFNAMRVADATSTGARVVTHHGMVRITGAVVLAGLAGTLIGWFVTFSGILY